MLVRLLARRDPFLHVRFGDGDVFFATGTGPTLTGDGEEWTPELSTRLAEAWVSFTTYPGTLLLGDVESYDVSDGCELEWRRLLAMLCGYRDSARYYPYHLVHMEALRCSRPSAPAFYRAVALDGRRKAFVGPERLAGAAAMLGADHVVVPLRTAHKSADALATDVGSRGYELALFAAGRGGKIMQSILGRTNPDLAQIDVGSGLDLLFTDLRRGTDAGLDPATVRRAFSAAGLDP